jgi:hypothetical protein
MGMGFTISRPCKGASQDELEGDSSRTLVLTKEITVETGAIAHLTEIMVTNETPMKKGTVW